MAKKYDSEENLVIRTMKGDLARLRGELELKEGKKEKEVVKKKKELPTIEKKPEELAKIAEEILKEEPEELPKELPEGKEELVKKAPPPLGLPTLERRPPTPPAPPEPSVEPPPKAPEEKAILPPPKPKIPEAPKIPKVPEVSKALEVPKAPKVPKVSKVPRTLLLGGIVVALGAAAILIYWFLFAHPLPPLPPPPPPPPPTITKPAPLIPVQRQIIIELEEDQEVISELRKQIEEGVPGLTQILVYKDSLSPLSLEKVFEEFGLKAPQPLINNLDKDYTLLLFAQEELLTATGTPRLGFITEVKSITVSSQIMRIWEDTMAEDLEEFYLVSRGEQAAEGFDDNTYKNIDVRFLNFPMRDITIDYGFWLEENWLILATSRQFIYRIIDFLEVGEIEEL